MLSLPCTINRCLKFPVCKSKETIVCNLLYNYLSKTIDERKIKTFKFGYESFESWWKRNMKPIFKNAEMVTPDPKEYIPMEG